jgi:hypothetical protein
MYSWVWRHLPGPVAMRLAIALLLVAVVIVLLFTVVFPWAEANLPFLQVTVDETSTG